MPSVHYHRSRYTSRIFVVVLACVLAGGAFYFFKKLKTSQAAQPTPAPAGQTGKPASSPGAGAPVKPVAHTPGQPAPLPSPTPAAGALSAAQASQLLTDARNKLTAGDLLGARQPLGDHYAAGRIAGADGEAARSLLAEINGQLVLAPRKVSGDPYVDLVTVNSAGDMVRAARSHAVPWEAVCRINQVSDRKIRPNMSLKVPHGPFHAVVSKSIYRLDLYLGGLPGEPGAMYVSSLPVGLGENNSTPTGLWTCAAGSKGRNLDWTNPRTNERFAGDDPKNPLGGFWIGLKGEEGNAAGKQSYGIHGTIEPDSIGKQMSMGCVRLRHDDIALVYDLLSEGKSRVWIRD